MVCLLSKLLTQFRQVIAKLLAKLQIVAAKID
nr:MAG TPA: hypothetical protein [Bacteriophage sp.]